MQPLYPHSQKAFSPEIFANPPAEYRGTPFWSWNNKLDIDQLKRQIEVFKEMGLGGGHMHVRTGMATEYMSEEYLDIVAACVEKFEQENMLGWLYDEDRWPSGAAGGLVTRDEKYRTRHLLLTRNPYGSSSKAIAHGDSRAGGCRNENGLLLAGYEINLDGSGYMQSYRRLNEGETPAAESVTWYAYIEHSTPTPWFNNQGYVDTLNPEAIAKFIEVTHERYHKRLGDKFGKSVPAIFTDEPQFPRKASLLKPDEERDMTLPFTGDFAKSFQKEYGYDILDKLPEVFWEIASREYSPARYHYHQHVCERFSEAFCDQIGKWCEKHDIMLTGHMMEEPTLHSQSEAVGDAMRAYEHFQLPGIDMLCAGMEFTTAKQAQSASRQYGRPGVLSELYGVTGWDYDFNGHKQQGDWQAALGVTVRVQHLSWVSMEGEAKRDYPASISYQSPWWKKYRVVEDHFARVNYALTRGKAVCNIGVIHPVESYWINCGPNTQTAAMRDELDQNFQNLTKWLLYGLHDFDFISESLLPRQKTDFTDGNFQLGEMNYKVILVQGMQTIRSTTLDKLEQFVQAGGTLLFLGNVPQYVDAIPSERARKLADKCRCFPMSRSRIFDELAQYREIRAINTHGTDTGELLYQLRRDGNTEYLFICNTSFKNKLDNIELTLHGEWQAEVLDTHSGKSCPLPTKTEKGYTKFYYTFEPVGSLLLKLSPASSGCSNQIKKENYSQTELAQLNSPVPVTLDEPNVLVLDQAIWRINNGQWQKREELLRLENIAREKCSLQHRAGHIAQPWTEKADTTAKGEVELVFDIDCRADVKECWLAIERAADFTIELDGKVLQQKDCGWWVDECIRKLTIPGLTVGSHKLSLRCNVCAAMALEWCYLLGDFGVKVAGSNACITEPVRKLIFGNYTTQGLPFYSGNLTYHCNADIPQNANTLRIPHFKGAMVSVKDEAGNDFPVAYAPFECPVKPGNQKLDITIWGTRQNSFGCLHRVSENSWIGPFAWREVNNSWSYEYQLKPAGILSSPRLINVQK